MENIIDVNAIAFRYEKKNIFDNLSVTLKKGDFCSILGPNGSGKTTFIKCIAGILNPSSGTIKIQGKEIKDFDIKEKAKKIAYVPQNQYFVFDITVYEYVMMGRNPYQSPWKLEMNNDREIVENILLQCNIMQYKDTSIHSLSGGEFQRVMIARAMAQETDILLLDEPLSNIDISHKFEIMDILRQQNQTKCITILIILHDLTIAHLYSKQIMFIKDGKILDFGDKNAVLNEKNIRESFDLGERYIIKNDGCITISKYK